MFVNWFNWFYKFEFRQSSGQSQDLNSAAERKHILRKLPVNIVFFYFSKSTQVWLFACWFTRSMVL